MRSKHLLVQSALAAKLDVWGARGAGQMHNGGPLGYFHGDDTVAIGQEPDEH